VFASVDFLPDFEHLFYAFRRHVLYGTHHIDVAALDIKVLVLELVEPIQHNLLIFVQLVDLLPLEPQLVDQFGDGDLIGFKFLFQSLLFVFVPLDHFLVGFVLVDVVFQL
jgi:hypothetical protein